jgi:hypothetical protein
MNTETVKRPHVREAIRVVGIRIDGTRVVISHHESRTAAETATHLIQRGPEYSEILIESERRLLK